MRRRDFIAGAVATAALNFARPVYAQTDARPRGIKRIAIVHPSEKPEEMTVSGRRSFKSEPTLVSRGESGLGSRERGTSEFDPRRHGAARQKRSSV